MEETLTAKIIHALVFLAICAAIIAIGWNEPLRYRFMSPEEIAEVEHPAPPPSPRPTPTWIDIHKTPDKLAEPPQPASGNHAAQAKSVFSH